MTQLNLPAFAPLERRSLGLSGEAPRCASLEPSNRLFVTIDRDGHARRLDLRSNAHETIHQADGGYVVHAAARNDPIAAAVAASRTTTSSSRA